MGSRGTGRFTDYPGTPSGSAKGSRGRGSNSKGKHEIDQCEQRLVNVPLEEVARCEYFAAHHGLPSVGTSVSVRPRLVDQRLGVETVNGSEIVGLMPTEYNYLLQCMKQQYTYHGQVKTVRTHPIPVIRVDLEPSK